METPHTQPGIGLTLQAYEDRIVAQIRAASRRIDEFKWKAKPRRAQAEVAAIDGLKAARQNIERMLVDLKTAVPSPYPERCSRRVLTMECLEGVRAGAP
ncbi:MAG: hypothetical protein AB7N65_16710 [Vicinamibacterales bacterium]